jgi:hypothetical protein
MKRPTRNLAAAIMLLLLAIGGYYCVWRLHIKDRVGPFAENPLPDNVVVSTLTSLFRPLEELDYKQEQKSSLRRLCAEIEGHWKQSGSIYSREGAHEVLIDKTTITFTNAPGWPDLHKKTFEIEVYQKELSYFSIDGRPFKIETISYFDGDRLQITESNGERLIRPPMLLRPMPLLARFDKANKANKAEMATPRRPSD